MHSPRHKRNDDIKPIKQSPEIDNHTMKLIVGGIALSLAYLTDKFAVEPLTSISASYWDKGLWSGNIFVGFLFAISAFLLSYNGHNRWEKWLSKIAALAAIGVALFPCGCDGQRQIIPMIHYISAVVMFSVLAVFCYFFFLRAWKKGWAQARVRAVLYGACGAAIVLAMMGMVADHLTDDSLSQRFEQFTFYAEATGLVAFGFAWLIASRAIPYLTRSDERLSIL